MESNWERAKSDLRTILSSYWQFPDYRPAQLEIVKTLLATESSLNLLATGGGKSLCFQSVGIYLKGLTLVFSPLISLMQDQVSKLKKLGIAAEMYSSLTTTMEKASIWSAIAKSELQFLYLAPETLQNKTVVSKLLETKISLIVIDEAHCVSIWGHDFRPAFLKIKEFTQTYTSVNKCSLKQAAFTATATSKVIIDICHSLGLANPKINKASFKRDNFSIQVKPTLEIEVLRQILLTRLKVGACLIYVATRKGTEELAQRLQALDLPAVAFHAGLMAEKRTEIQAQYLNNELSLLIATNAFGMGVDKSDVRTVIHYDLPDSIENYFQEIGRAGRDASESLVILNSSWKGIAFRQKMLLNRFPSGEQYQKVYNYLLRVCPLDVFTEIEQQQLLLLFPDLNASKLFKIWQRLWTKGVIAVLEADVIFSLRSPPVKLKIALLDRKVWRLAKRLALQTEEKLLENYRLKLTAMCEFCWSSSCRQKFLLNYFSEKSGNCGKCDNCQNNI